VRGEAQGTNESVALTDTVASTPVLLLEAADDPCVADGRATLDALDVCRGGASGELGAADDSLTAYLQCLYPDHTEGTRPRRLRPPLKGCWRMRGPRASRDTHAARHAGEGLEYWALLAAERLERAAGTRWLLCVAGGYVFVGGELLGSGCDISPQQGCVDFHRLYNLPLHIPKRRAVLGCPLHRKTCVGILGARPRGCVCWVTRTGLVHDTRLMSGQAR